MSEKTRQNEKIAEEGGQPISAIFLLVVAPIKVVTMITFISSLTLLFSRTDHPPQKKKSPKRGAERSDFRWTSQEYISPFIQATDTSLHPHNPFQMNTRTNVVRSSLTFCTPTINAYDIFHILFVINA